MTATIRAGVVGSGAEAELHVRTLEALGVDVVGVSPDPSSLASSGATVIHVVADDGDRAELASRALEQGAHVLVGAPVARSVASVRLLAETAARTGRFVSVDPGPLADPRVAAAVAAAGGGRLGSVRSVEVVRALPSPGYEGGPLPRRLADPAAELVDAAPSCVAVLGAVLGPPTSMEVEHRCTGSEPDLVVDDWTATVHCRDGVGTFRVTHAVRPAGHVVVIEGTAGTVRVDDGAVLAWPPPSRPLPAPVRRPGTAVRGVLRPLVGPARSALAKVARNAGPDSGTRAWIADSYAALRTGARPPHGPEDLEPLMILVERAADRVRDEQSALLASLEHAETADVLVTGGAGQLGSAVVRRLADRGDRVRALVRRVPSDPVPGVDYRVGNLGDPDAVDRAVAGASRVVHVGATMRGGRSAHRAGTVEGTRNVVDAALRRGIDQLVHISSMSVPERIRTSEDGALTESTPVEPHPDRRGPYTEAKVAAEAIVTDAVRHRGLPAVVLRPGGIIGPGTDLASVAVVRPAGSSRWLVLGDGSRHMGLVALDDVVDAVVAALDRDVVDGEIVQIVNDEPITQDEMVALLGDGRSVVHVPAWLVVGVGAATDVPLRALGRASPLAPYRMRAGMAPVRYRSSRAAEVLGWRPRTSNRAMIEAAGRPGSQGSTSV